jgi:Protein of unknown function (DUF2637)
MKAKDWAKVLALIAAIVVAAIAALVSFNHIRQLSIAEHESYVNAILMPLTVDGLIVAGSLAMLSFRRLRWHREILDPDEVKEMEMRHKRARRLGRFALWLGIAATLTANYSSAAGYGWPSAVIAMWPAVSFIVSAETVIAMFGTEIPVADMQMPPLRRIQTELGIGQEKAQKLQAMIRATQNGNGKTADFEARTR